MESLPLVMHGKRGRSVMSYYKNDNIPYFDILRFLVLRFCGSK
jgi:hypothetical protein